MKKSRITKLALSGAAVAALAATFSTSTYAWYVSNKQADVKGGTGTTGAAGSDGSVLVSWTGGTGEVWFKEINFDDDSDAVKNPLAPIHYDGGFYSVTETGTKASSVSTAYIKFDVYVKTGTSTTVTPHINITTTKQSSNNGQVAYVADNTYVQAKAFVSGKDYYERGYEYKLPETAPTSATFSSTTYYTRSGSGTTESPYTYTVVTEFDSSAASSYYIYAEKYTKNESVTSSNFAGGTYYFKCDNTLPGSTEKGATFTVDALKAIWVQQVVEGGETTYFAPDTTSAGGDAHAYYTAVTGYIPWATTTPSSSLGTISTTADTQQKITYTIYLDGADLDCYNSCAGYDIAFDLQFTI